MTIFTISMAFLAIKMATPSQQAAGYPKPAACWLPPPKKINENNILFFRLLMILGLPKNPQSGRACAPGGSAR
jgi:hypothetical protein